MSNSTLDELAEVARNRGLKLVRSRVRTTTKAGFGKVGLADKEGRAVFGMDSKAPTGTAEDVEEYLRALTAKDWGQSLGTHERSSKLKPRSQSSGGASIERAGRKKEELRKSGTPEPSPKVRRARPADAPRIAELLDYLGHPIDAAQVRKNLGALKKSDETPLVATRGNRVIGLCGIGKRVVIARPLPIGRITSLVVAREEQGKGIGRMLVEAAEDELRKAGCGLVEVTSNDRLSQAHAFYRHVGYDRTSIRFAKELK